MSLRDMAETVPSGLTWNGGRGSVNTCLSGMRGLGALAVATDADKARLTAQALGLFGQSKTVPTDMLRGQIQGALGELGYYQPWTDTSHFWSTGTWHDSQTVRSNLQQALENVDIATGYTSAGSQVSSSWRPQTQEMAPVSVANEFIANIPGEVKNQTLAPKCSDYLPAFVCEHPYATAAGAVGLVGALVFAPQIARTVRAAVFG